MPRPAEGSQVDVHRHAWSSLDFFVADDRPMIRQHCGCGSERAVPAWDRSWTPAGEAAERPNGIVGPAIGPRDTSEAS